MDAFSWLLYCSETIPEGLGFPLFGTGHRIWLLAIAAVCAGVCHCYRRTDGGGRLRTRRIVSALLLADELLKIGVLCATGCYTAEYLPLHVCSINIFICLWYTLKPNPVAAEILYALSLPGAIVALCAPTWVRLPFCNLMSFHSFSVHGLLLLYPLLLLTAGEYRPRLKRMWIPGLFVAALSPALYWFNCRFHTNFMFLNGTEDNVVLETVCEITGERFYIAGLGALVLLVWLLFYLPWEAGKRRKKEI
ncbi:MAG: YwaF family protein [Lachnospiraceae bacterium]|jgi:hypothetical integral membrane protein (TIGR02206 family)|nr:YwaF family protein [Lachnospiraceae bacterium]